MRLDPARTRMLSFVLLGSGAALVLFGAFVRTQQGAAGIAVMAAGLADVTIGIVLLARSRV